MNNPLDPTLAWYLVHTKPRQEKSALLNLEQQGYECYLPLLAQEKLRDALLTVVHEALFPRYLFIRLSHAQTGKSWGPIRSTKGVSRLVCFGSDAARIDDALIELLRAREHIARLQPRRLFTPGERVRLSHGPFAGLDAIYEMHDGASRVMVLIEMLGKPVRVQIEAGGLLRAS